MPTCTATGCTSPAVAHGLCMRDYQRARRAGDLPEREPTSRLELRVPDSIREALGRDTRNGETVHGVALRWLRERAAKPAKTKAPSRSPGQE